MNYNYSDSELQLIEKIVELNFDEKDLDTLFNKAMYFHRNNMIDELYELSVYLLNKSNIVRNNLIDKYDCENLMDSTMYESLCSEEEEELVCSRINTINKLSKKCYSGYVYFDETTDGVDLALTLFELYKYFVKANEKVIIN